MIKTKIQAVESNSNYQELVFSNRLEFEVINDRLVVRIPMLDTGIELALNETSIQSLYNAGINDSELSDIHYEIECMIKKILAIKCLHSYIVSSF